MSVSGTEAYLLAFFSLSKRLGQLPLGVMISTKWTTITRGVIDLALGARVEGGVISMRGPNDRGIRIPGVVVRFQMRSW